MAWSCIRIAIFITAFLIGLLVSGSGRGSTTGSADSKKDPARTAGESGDIQCVDDRFILINGKEGASSGVRFTGM